MARHKDTQWNLPEGVPDPQRPGFSTHLYGSIHAALLMDIRDELKRINAALWCRNFVAIPSTLRRIAKNTARKRKAKKP